MIDPAASELYPGYCEKFAEMRAKKGVTLEQAQKTMLDPLFFAAMMVYDDKADGIRFRRYKYHRQHTPPRASR